MPWWNHDLKVLRQQANRAFHKAYKSGLEQDWQAHREVRRSFKKLLRQSKRDSWRDFCSHVEGTHESSRIYKILGRSQAGHLGMLCTPSGQWTTNPEEVYQHLLETHFPGCRICTAPAWDTDTVRNYTPRWQPNHSWRLLEEVVSVDRIKWAISTMAPFKSPGKDGIFPVLLQKGIQHLVDARYIQGFSAFGIYTQSLVYCTSCIYPKPGKLDYTTAKAFRPISSTSFLLKGMEKNWWIGTFVMVPLLIFRFTLGSMHSRLVNLLRALSINWWAE